MPEESDHDVEGVEETGEQADADATDAADDPFDRRVAPYSGETDVAVDPVEPPEREETESIEPDLPEATIEEAERLTRLARRVPDDAEAESYRDRRADLLAEYDYAAMIRDDGDAAGTNDAPTLVCHPIEWRDDEGAIDPARIDEIDRAADVELGGAGDPESWDAVAERNEAVVEQVRDAHGDRHAANAEALAEFVSNHHAKPIAAVTAAELRWFREEYYSRNVWPTDEQAAALDQSIAYVYEELDVPMPTDESAE
ncbi:hypothetical protein GCM10028857_15610 [Salinarchaeum chitinilyticum]